MKYIAILFLLINIPLHAEDTHQLLQSIEKLQDDKKELYKTLADELRCPTCTGLSVLQSETPFSMEIKASLVEQITAGKNEKEILSFFKERFGLWILRTPPKEGFHWFAWYVPIGLILLGALFVWGLFWRRRRVSFPMGIRSREEILQEMDERLQERRGVL